MTNQVVCRCRPGGLDATRLERRRVGACPSNGRDCDGAEMSSLHGRGLPILLTESIPQAAIAETSDPVDLGLGLH